MSNTPENGSQPNMLEFLCKKALRRTVACMAVTVAGICLTIIIVLLQATPLSPAVAGPLMFAAPVATVAGSWFTGKLAGKAWLDYLMTRDARPHV